jgi:hypothetical protein
MRRTVEAKPTTTRKSILAVCVALLFCMANVISYYLMPECSTMDDGFVYFGWPFDMYAEGGFAGTRAIIWTGLIGNIVLALCAIRLATRFLTKA